MTTQQIKLNSEIQSLFARYAPEYILAAVRDELYNRSTTNNCREAGETTHDALVAFCRGLPGYRDQLTGDTTDFNPRW